MNKLRSLIKEHRWGVGFALFFGLLMVLPYISFPMQMGNLYQGVGRVMADDTLFYLARIRDAMDGHLNLSNAYLWEHKEGFPQQLFFVEDLLGITYRLLHLDIISGFIATTAIASFIAAMLVYAISYLISQSKKSSVYATFFLFIGIFPISFLRPVSPQVNVLFWLFQILILILCLKRPMTKRLLALNSLAFGLLFYVYPYYWTHLVVTYALFIVYAWFIDRVRAKRLFLSAVGGCVLAIPYFLLSMRTSQLPEFSESLLRMGMVQTHMPGSFVTLACVCLCSVIFGISWIKGFRPSLITSFLIASLIAVAIATNQQVITGKDMVFSSHYLQIAVFLSVFFLLGLVSFIDARCSPRKWWSFGAICLLTIVSVFGFKQYVSLFGSISEYDVRVQSYRPAIDWLNEHAQKDSVVYANEELSNLITVYTSANVFFSGNISSFICTNQEVVRRFIYNYFFEDFTPEMILQNERIVFNGQYVTQAGKLRQGNKIREILGLDPVLNDVIHQQAIQSVMDQAKEIQSTDIDSMRDVYRVDYVVWDTLINPNWKLYLHPKVVSEYQDGRFVIYGFLKDR
jgi:hypothetical protein